TCWARSIGNCSTKQSLEHFISANLFGREVAVRGFRWCPSEFKTIGIGSAGAKILCTTHNTALSELDQAAGRAKRVLGEMARAREDRVVTLRVLGPRRFRVRRYAIDGHLIERWAIKCLAGLFSATGQDEDRWSLTQTDPIEPPPALVN